MLNCGDPKTKEMLLDPDTFEQKTLDGKLLLRCPAFVAEDSVTKHGEQRQVLVHQKPMTRSAVAENPDRSPVFKVLYGRGAHPPSARRHAPRTSTSSTNAGCDSEADASPSAGGVAWALRGSQPSVRRRPESSSARFDRSDAPGPTHKQHELTPLKRKDVKPRGDNADVVRATSQLAPSASRGKRVEGRGGQRNPRR